MTIAGQPVSNRYATNSDGEYHLTFLTNPEELDANEELELRIEFHENFWVHILSTDDISQSVLTELTVLPAIGSLKIVQQPLVDQDSVATFDAILFNTGGSLVFIPKIVFSLQTYGQDCDGQVDETGAEVVSDVFTVELDNKSLAIGSDIPVISKIDVMYFNKFLCAQVTAYPDISIESNSAKRFRFNVTSKEVREKFREYSEGIGPMVAAFEAGQPVFADTPRFRKRDLRFYSVTATARIDPAARNMPAGEFSGDAQLTPGTFQADVETIGLR